jgi:hypothetical protein
MLEPFRDTPERQEARARQAQAAEEERIGDEKRARGFLADFAATWAEPSQRTLATLTKLGAAHGFSVERINHDRGGVSLWLGSRYSNSNIGSGQTVEEALLKAVSHIERYGVAGVR